MLELENKQLKLDFEETQPKSPDKKKSGINNLILLTHSKKTGD